VCSQLVEFFNGHAPVNSVRLRRHLVGPAVKPFKGSIFVEFKSAEHARKVLWLCSARGAKHLLFVSILILGLRFGNLFGTGPLLYSRSLLHQSGIDVCSSCTLASGASNIFDV
jgi:hypothetical protein